MKQDGANNRETWAQRHNVLVGQQLRRYRKSAGLTVDGLAERLSEVGYPISRAKLTNLERARARQEGISVPEVIALAYCLGIPPVQLVFPLEENPKMQVIPQTTRTAWDGARWFTGADPVGLLSEDEFHRGSTPLAYRRSHDYYVGQAASWARQSRRWHEQTGETDDESELSRLLDASEHATEEEQRALRQLVMTRQAMRHAGLALPQVEPGLRQRLDELEELMNAGGSF